MVASPWAFVRGGALSSIGGSRHRDPGAAAIPRSRAARRARARGAASNRSRVEGDNQTEGIEPRSDFLDASVDHTDARNDVLGCVGRSHELGRFGRATNSLG